MRNVWMGIGFAVIWALAGWSQCVELSCLSFDGPSVAFKLCVQVAGATCSNVPKTPPAPSDTIRCSVSEGASGTVDLTVNRTAPDGFMGGIVLTGSVPGGWPTFTPVSKTGSGDMSLTAQYRFTVPPGTAGRSFELKFKVAADGCYGELILTVILDVAGPSGPRLYGPYTGTTNENGRFSVPIRDLPNTQVGGTLTECTVRVLPRTPVTIYVAADMPTFGSAGFMWASYPMTPLAQQAPSISYILISVPGYPQVKITQFFVLPIIVGGTTHFMVDVGTVSLPALTCQAQGGIGGTTDSAGNFRVNVGSGTTISGRLTECTVKPLPNQTFTVVPKFSGGELDELKFVVPGYADTTVTKAVSVVHLGAMKYINLGDVCMLPKAPDSAKPDAGITGKTDSNGAFTSTIKPGTTVSGRLTVCTVTPIDDELYTVTPEYGADGAITAFRFSVSGYADTTVTEFSTSSFFGLFTAYDVGDVCFSIPSKEPPPAPRPEIILLGTGLTEEALPVYFLRQSVDELLRFKIVAPPGSVVERLTATFLPVFADYEEPPDGSDLREVDLQDWLIEKNQWARFDPDNAQPGQVLGVDGFDWTLPVPVPRAFQLGTFEKLSIDRWDRVRDTPVNEVTHFRIQETALDSLRIRSGQVALGEWVIEGDIRTPDGVLHEGVKSVTDNLVGAWVRRLGRSDTEVWVPFPQVYQVFSWDALVYELGQRSSIRAVPAEAQEPTVTHRYSLVEASRWLETRVSSLGTISLRAAVDLRDWEASTQLMIGGNWVFIGNPQDEAARGNAELSTQLIYVCPAVGKEDLPAEGVGHVQVSPPKVGYRLYVDCSHDVAVEWSQKIFTAIVGGALTPGMLTIFAGEKLALLQESLEGLVRELGFPLAKFVAEAVIGEAALKVLETLGEVVDRSSGPKMLVAVRTLFYQKIVSGKNELVATCVKRTLEHEGKEPKTDEQSLSGCEPQLTLHWDSRERPSYRLVTGAAASVSILGEAEAIKNFHAWASVVAGIEGMYWTLADVATHWESMEDISGFIFLYDPEPSSTWLELRQE